MKQVIRKDDKAVSPIIATILLVAITVVLAATLYTILGGYTTFLGASTPLGDITVTNTSAGSLHSYRVYVNQFGGNISLNYTEMEIVNSNGTVTNVVLGAAMPSITDNGTGYNWTVSVAGGSYLSSTTIIDLTHSTSDKGGKINATYVTEIRLVDLRTNGVIGTGSPTN
jgi:flagellin-like protein